MVRTGKLSNDVGIWARLGHDGWRGWRSISHDHAASSYRRACRQEVVKRPSLGSIVSVRGSVVDVRFDEHLPPIYSVLRAGDQGRIVIEVLAQLDARHVRGIALTPTQGLARGMAVQDTG